MDEHDTSYKLLFSHDRMVRDLLTGFLPREWIAALFRLEHHRSSAEVAGLLQLLVKWLSGPEQAGLRRAYLEWLRRRLPKWFPGETFPEMHDLQEAYEMITNRFEEWKERQLETAARKWNYQRFSQGTAETLRLSRYILY